MRIFAGVVLLVLIGGIGLLIAPDVVAPRWPWPLSPYAARFLGAIYAAEFVALAILVGINRWAPGRLTLAMALTFTFLVTIVSAFDLQQFNLARRGPWIWFVLYGGSALVSAALLWQHRRLHHPGTERTGGWRAVLMVEAVILGGYGALMLASPLVATAYWPWPADAFTGRVYSGMFVAAGLGALLISLRSSPLDDVAFGLTQVALGSTSLVSAWLATPPSPVPQVYRPPSLTLWSIGCLCVVLMGVLALVAPWSGAGKRRWTGPTAD